MPESSEDVFSLFSPADIRRARDNSLHNIESLILALTSRLSLLRHHKLFPSPTVATEKEALNCIRVLTRVLPFIYEADHLEAWEDEHFWQSRKSIERSGSSRGEVLFDESQPETIDQPADEPKVKEIRPLGEELIDTLIDLLFYSGFTVPHNDRSRTKVSYSIWQTGVGCNTPMSSSKELESNRAEVLRLLLTIASKSLYMPARGPSFQQGQSAHLTIYRHSTDKRSQSSHVYCHLS